jgi:hypothetical protein
VTRSSPAQFAYSSGEISPLLWRRPDYQRFQTGLSACRGFLPLRQGGFTRAPGTLYRGTTRSNLPARLIAFQFAANDAVTLEFTDGKMRVWRYGALVEDSGSPGTPYELATPYDDTSIARLHWVQSADVIWLADGLQPVQKLSRFALDNWTIAPAAFNDGPFRVQNLDEALTLQASATTGSITLTASAAFFAPEHVGSLMRLSPTDFSNIPLWTGNTAISVGQKMRYDGNAYQLVAGTDTGVNPPVHTSGTQLVQAGVKWKFLNDGAGILRIDAVTDSTHATATVLKTLPNEVKDDPTYRFEEGAWSDRWGYPSCLEIYDQRLVLAATPSDPRTVWFSAVGGFEEFEPGTDADSAFAYAIAGGSSVNRILWLARGKTGLHIGALGEEHSTRSDTKSQSISITTTVFGFDSSIGSKPDVQPIAPDGWPIFVSRDGRRAIEIRYAFDQDANQPRELSLPSDHLGADGFDEIAWTAAPQRIAWFRRGNGELAAMIHDPAEEVLGWAPYPLAGGIVESTAVTSDATGTYDTLTMVVRRTVNGSTVRMIEEQAVTYGLLTGNEPIWSAVHFFAATVFAPGAATDSFSLPHLAGEMVEAWTDAGEFGSLTVANDGTVTLPNAVSHAVIGLFDATHRARTLDIQAAAPDGNTMGRQKRLSMPSGIALHRSAAGRVAAVERDFPSREHVNKAYDLIPRAVAQDLTEAFTGIARPGITSGHAGEVMLEFTPVSGAPLTILATVPTISEAGL